ncbi:MAG TPA: potassium channel family protein [Candidatus Saccharimonadales bacterium]|jgi:hypothetical protein
MHIVRSIFSVIATVLRFVVDKTSFIWRPFARFIFYPVVKFFIAVAKELHWVLLAYITSRIIAMLVFMVLEGWNPLEAFWWSGVAALTIGYGDFFPESTAGRLIADVFQHFWIFYCGLAIGAHVVKFLIKEFHVFTHKEQEWLFDAVTRCYELLRFIALLLVRIAEKHDIKDIPPIPFLHNDMIAPLPLQPKDLEDEEIVDEYDNGPNLDHVLAHAAS